MITKQLFDIINNISDDLITEAANPHKRIKRIRISKVILIAAVMVTLLGFTAWAANMVIVSRTGHSSNIPDYYTVPTQATLLKDIGISMNVIDKFSTDIYSEKHLSEIMLIMVKTDNVLRNSNLLFVNIFLKIRIYLCILTRQRQAQISMMTKQRKFIKIPL